MAAIVFTGVPLLSIGTAYAAKMLCSETFVAGRPLDDVMTDLEIDDLRALRVIHAQVNSMDRTTTARFLGLIEHRARFHGELGCALEPGARTPGEAADGRGTHSGSDASGAFLDTLAVLPPRVRLAVEAVLDEAFSEPDSTHRRRTRAIVVMQHGKVVAERYARGIGPETPLAGWSMAKSVLNALVGVAVREGKLALNRPAHLQAWNTPGDPRSSISVSDLLRMSSGLQFTEDMEGPSSDLLRMLFRAPDMAAFAANKKLEGAPGTRWKYSSGTSMILSRLLREVLGDQEYHRFPRRALFDPLGMRSAVLEADASGTFVASSYMYATAREWARFGQLYLQDGVWMGTRILPEGWVDYTRRPAPADPRSAYGAHFWRSTPAEYRGTGAALPADVLQAAGHEAQFVTIVPSYDAVIVRLGRTRHASDWTHDRFVLAVLAALAR